MNNDSQNTGNNFIFIKKIVSFFWEGLWILALTFFILMFIIMFFQVFARYILKFSFPWTGELARILCIWSTFIGVALAQKSNNHIIVPVLLDILSEQKRYLITIISDIISLLISLIILSGAWIMVQKTYGVLTSTMNMSYSYLYLFLGLGIAIMVVLILKKIILQISYKHKQQEKLKGSELY